VRTNFFRKRVRAYLIASLVSLFIGAMDEYHQISLPRDASLSDLFLDGVGITLALLIFYFYEVKNENQKNKRFGSES